MNVIKVDHKLRGLETLTRQGAAHGAECRVLSRLSPATFATGFQGTSRGAGSGARGIAGIVLGLAHFQRSCRRSKHGLAASPEKVHRVQKKSDDSRQRQKQWELEERQAEFWDHLFEGPEDSFRLAGEDPDVLRQKRVMIMISDTGGGHRASAMALADALQELYPVHITIRDVWTESCPFPFNTVVKQYMWMAKHTWSWRMLWYSSKFPVTRWMMQRFANILCKRIFMKAIQDDAPDLIISVHPGTQHIVIKALKKLARRQGSKSRIPFVTVVTDLGSAHPMWFHPEADRVFVPSDPVKDIALKCRVRESVIEEYGLPLRRAFWNAEPRTRQEVRDVLGIRQLKTVLVVGGGDGVGRLFNVAEALGQNLQDLADTGGAQLVVICGKNEKVRKQLQAMQWPDAVHAHIVGFVKNMDEWMAAADVIVTKAGPGTIAEACTRKLPVMLSSYLPGQEQGNVGFVVDGGFGDFCSDPRTIARTVVGWLQDEEALRRMSKNAGEQGRPRATLKIAQAIGQKWLATSTSTLLSMLEKLLKSELNSGAATGLDTGASERLPEHVGQQLSDALRGLKQAQQDCQSSEASLRDAKERVRQALAEAGQFRGSPMDLFSRSGA
ncbi:MGD1 [Symbiodinium natans]|uniref:monogalactosyldiacylglycerol synthase n=1 Tax=Symbiodinium natans TaxID=878477 RepID=A0A812SN19_9DINO|nr:MGD1 [Symbiodinium natans]